MEHLNNRREVQEEKSQRFLSKYTSLKASHLRALVQHVDRFSGIKPQCGDPISMEYPPKGRLRTVCVQGTQSVMPASKSLPRSSSFTHWGVHQVPHEPSTEEHTWFSQTWSRAISESRFHPILSAAPCWIRHSVCLMRTLSEKKEAPTETPPTLRPESQLMLPGTFSKCFSFR